MGVMIVQILIAVATIGSAWGIARYHIQTGNKLNADNLKVNEQNAGKNRIIYEVEVMHAGDKDLKTKLDSGKYTILTAYANPGSWSNTVVVLGKINP